MFRNLRGIAVDWSNGAIIVADSSNHALRRILQDSNGAYNVETIAGNKLSCRNSTTGLCAQITRHRQWLHDAHQQAVERDRSRLSRLEATFKTSEMVLNTIFSVL